MKFTTVPQPIPWPNGVAERLNVSAESLQAARGKGDAPKLYAVTERKLVTTDVDLAEWLALRHVPPTYRCRAPTSRSKRATTTTA